MSTKRAGIAAIGSKDAIIRLSFDKLATWYEAPGVIEFDRTSGQASVYEGNPLREESFLRFGALSSGAMSLRVFQTPHLEVYSKMLDAHANKELIYVEPAIPREVIASFLAVNNTSIAIDDTGVVTFAPADFPIDDQPFGKGCVIEIGNNNYVINDIDINAQTGAVTTKVLPAPPADIAASDGDIVFPGLRWGYMGAFVTDYADTMSNDGGATTAFNLRIQGQPTKAVIDRTIT